MTDTWQTQAACRGMSADLFFPGQGESTRESKETCAECPVTAECLDFALTGREKFGIWGGMSERERRRIRVKSFTRGRAVCGTAGGYQRHIREGTPTCTGCKRAKADQQAGYVARKREAV